MVLTTPGQDVSLSVSLETSLASKIGTHLHLGRVRKWRIIITPKDKTRFTDAGNRTLDPQTQSLTLYRLSQQAPQQRNSKAKIKDLLLYTYYTI